MYRFDPGGDGARPQLTMRHQISEDLAYPEDVAASPDGSLLAVSHSMSDKHGISLHSIDPTSLAPRPTQEMLRVGRAFHGLSFSPDSRFLGRPLFLTAPLNDQRPHRRCRLGVTMKLHSGPPSD